MHSSRSRIVVSVVIAVIAGLLIGACSPAPSPSLSPSTAIAQPRSAPPSTAPGESAIPPDASDTPAASPDVAGLTRVPVTAGPSHSCAITSSGGVKCWGSNVKGQLGGSLTTSRSMPADVPNLTSGVTAVAIGDYHSCALTSVGGVKCWGTDLIADPKGPPTDVPGLTSGVVAITAGGRDTCALTDRGGVKCWTDDNGLLFPADMPNYAHTPVDIAGLTSGVASVVTGGGHVCALMDAGEVRCWGYNLFGELGDGTTFNSTTPVSVTKLGVDVAAVTTGAYHTCAITSDGGVKCWGDGREGQLGNGKSKSSTVPVDVKGLSKGVVAIAAGFGHTCALTGGGVVKCWGSNMAGQLGNDAMQGSTVPSTVTGLPSDATAISASSSNTCATTDDGRVTCWGENTSGQLGTHSTCTSSSVPVEIPLASGVVVQPDEPFVVPTGKIAHATGRADVLLRFDMTPDVGSGRRAAEIFQPGPEFTLYGDGTVIYRNDRAQPPEPVDTIIRARGFKIARVPEKRIQSMLRYALTKGGLGDACERYSGNGNGGVTTVFTIRAGGVDKRVLVVAGPGPLKPLADRLRRINRNGDLATKDYVPTRYWGSLLLADSLIKRGDLPGPWYEPHAWPWKGVTPKKFIGLAGTHPGRRVMTRKEAAVLGLSQAGGVVERVYLRGPDGETIYAFSLWPVAPDEAP
jgi:alpha-tubulin suppressor-like RCC1 family protein